MAGEGQWVAGGELGSHDRSAQEFKQIILDILQEGETVTRALKRLKPPAKRAANKRKTRNTAKTNNDANEASEDSAEQAKKDKQFNSLTEAAGELMSIGFEDIYTDTRDAIASNLHSGADQGLSRGGAVWHDDGTVKNEAAKEHAMYQRSADNGALSYEEAAQAASIDQQPAAAAEQQIPTPTAAPITSADAASLDAAAAQGADASLGAPSDAAAEAQVPVTPAEQTHSDDVAVASESIHTVANGTQDSQHTDMPSTASAAMKPVAADGNAAKDNAQPLPAEAAAAGAHIAQAAEPLPEAPLDSATHAAEAAGSQHLSAQSSHAQEAAPDTEHKAQAATDTQSAGGNNDTALNASAVPVQQLPGTTLSTASPTVSAEGTGPDHPHTLKGPAKGPGLGESREFTGGPMNFERPKYRHSPYGPPPIRAGGRFLPAGGRGSPMGRGLPTGRSFGRGFSEPPRSTTMRPQYRQQPPQHMPPGVHPPTHYGYASQPPPPAFHQQPQYYPPPQQPLPPGPQGYPQQAYPAPPQQPYPSQQYAQPPQYDAQWQQYQDPQGQYAAYQQSPAYAPAAAAPPPGR